MIRQFLPFLRSRGGATSIEYAILAGMIALAVIGAVSTIGSTTNGTFETLSSQGWGA